MPDVRLLEIGATSLGGASARRSKDADTKYYRQCAFQPEPLLFDTGCVYDALRESRGDMLGANNQAALAASQLFNQSEGIDIDPAAAVALATLIKAVRFNRIPRRARVLLYITGGIGWLKRSLQSALIPAQPALTIAEGELHSDTTVERLVSLFRS